MTAGETGLERTRGRLSLKLDAKRLGGDLLVVITGGAAHIGAVGAGTNCNNMASSSVITLPGHRDDRIAKDAAERISRKTGSNCVVVVGIHYDRITDQEIKELIIMGNSLIDELEEIL
ncbi:MAG TPA: hypothetical protein VK436_15120 [Methanocella sp.]|nr:hypothetical protein [Methanocella sp.]